MSNQTKTTNTIENGSAAAAGIVANLTEGMSAAVEQSQAKLKDGIEKSSKQAEKIVRFGQANIEALTKSSQIWVEGVQDLSQQVADSFQASVLETMGVLGTLGTAKSLKEAIDRQSGLARTALEKAMSESGRLRQASLKLIEQALAPLTARVNVAVETFGKTV